MAFCSKCQTPIILALLCAKCMNEKAGQAGSISLHLDKPDLIDVQEAMKRRREWEMPDGASNANGAVLAEICRGWLEFMADEERPAAEPGEPSQPAKP